VGELIKWVWGSGTVNVALLFVYGETEYGSKQINGQVGGPMNRTGLMSAWMNGWAYEWVGG